MGIKQSVNTIFSSDMFYKKEQTVVRISNEKNISLQNISVKRNQS